MISALCCQLMFQNSLLRLALYPLTKLGTSHWPTFLEPLGSCNDMHVVKGTVAVPFRGVAKTVQFPFEFECNCNADLAIVIAEVPSQIMVHHFVSRPHHLLAPSQCKQCSTKIMQFVQLVEMWPAATNSATWHPPRTEPRAINNICALALPSQWQDPAK